MTDDEIVLKKDDLYALKKKATMVRSLLREDKSTSTAITRHDMKMLAKFIEKLLASGTESLHAMVDEVSEKVHLGNGLLALEDSP